jgi:hypothetical protein
MTDAPESSEVLRTLQTEMLDFVLRQLTARVASGDVPELSAPYAKTVSTQVKAAVLEGLGEFREDQARTLADALATALKEQHPELFESRVVSSEPIPGAEPPRKDPEGDPRGKDTPTNTNDPLWEAEEEEQEQEEEEQEQERVVARGFRARFRNVSEFVMTRTGQLIVALWILVIVMAVGGYLTYSRLSLTLVEQGKSIGQYDGNLNRVCGISDEITRELRLLADQNKAICAPDNPERAETQICLAADKMRAWQRKYLANCPAR